MAKEYLDRLTELIKRAAFSECKSVKLEVKHFFSGAAVYANGKIFITLTPVGLAIKLPERIREELIKGKKAKRLRYFPKAPIKKEYVVPSQELVKDVKTIDSYIKSSIAFVTK